MLIKFCLPIHNEEKILKHNVLKLLNYCEKQNFSFNWKIVLIINGSDDDSLQIVHKLSEQYSKIKIENIQQAGRGQALKKYWSTSKADIMAYMDIDLAASLDNIPRLIDPIILNKADLVIGSRLLPESKISRSFIRELSSQGYNFLSRVILKHHFSDLQCGFKAIRTNNFKKIAPFIKDNKWFFDTELIIFAKYFNYTIKEIPIDWSENRYNKRKSKVNLVKDSVKFIINLIKLKQRILKFNKLLSPKI